MLSAPVSYTSSLLHLLDLQYLTDNQVTVQVFLQYATVLHIHLIALQ